ncbi:2-hydroxyacid dehydrogenase [Marinomonas sp.]|uniref:2-hydroxyacid dehydrogenase n=1 Tax=Marinomonas sp. TaxID=1904862 RepID=UPI003C70B5EC
MSNDLLLITNNEKYTARLKAAFLERRPEINVLVAGDDRAEQAHMALCWHPEADLLTRYPNLKCLHSVAAGVDHLGTTLLTSGLPVCRVVDDHQKQGMLEYVLWGALTVQRNFDKISANQSESKWQGFRQRPASDIRVSVLGLGELGQFVARGLAQFGYTVSGWSRSPKNLDGIRCYHGPEGLTELLKETELLVNLLPLSPATKGILNKDLFNKMPEGGYIINVGRGGHLISGDLIDAIDSGHLRGALLDVFDQEPLPATDPLWTTKGVIITPHLASDASLPTIIEQVADNVLNFVSKGELNNQIDLVRGY